MKNVLKQLAALLTFVLFLATCNKACEAYRYIIKIKTAVKTAAKIWLLPFILFTHCTKQLPAPGYLFLVNSYRSTSLSSFCPPFTVDTALVRPLSPSWSICLPYGCISVKTFPYIGQPNRIPGKGDTTIHFVFIERLH